MRFIRQPGAYSYVNGHVLIVVERPALPNRQWVGQGLDGLHVKGGAGRQSKPAFAAVLLLAATATLQAGETADPSADQVATILSVVADQAYGEYLAGDCVTCHRASSSADGIPPIAGLPVEHLVKALVEYRLRIRDNEVMTVRAARLSDEEIAALAHHFALQKP